MNINYKRKKYILEEHNKKERVSVKMKTQQFSMTKEDLLREMSRNYNDKGVCFLLKINKDYRGRISEELKGYGQVLYEQFTWARYLGVEIDDSKKATSLVDHLYSGGMEGVLDVGVDSGTVILHKNHSGKKKY